MKKAEATPRIQFIHDTNPEVPAQIYAYVHCSKCIEELPADVTPQAWARTQCGWTEKGFQVMCTRHDINITNVEVAIK